MKLTVGQESNAIQTAGDRLTTYFQMGIGQGMVVSSPSIEGDLLYNQLDVFGTHVYAWQVRCGNCSRYQRLDFFDNLRYENDGDGTNKRAKCLCKYCGWEFTDKDNKRSWNNTGMYVRRLQNESGKWYDTEVNMDGIPQYEFKVTERIFFWWGSMESPFRTFHQIYDKYCQTKDKLHDYKHFIQCWLAQFWVDDISKTSVSNLRTHCSTYDKKDVPSQVKVLFAGIDTQDSGFYCVVRGFGADKYTALVDEFFCPCRIDNADEEEIIKIISRDIMDRIYLGKAGHWTIAMAAIDSGGHRTSTIYKVATAFPKLVVCKGRNEQSVTINYNKEINLYLVRTCEYLDETEIKSELSSFILPNNVSPDYLTQFCNVRKVQEINKKTGEKKIIWKKTGQCDYRFADVHSFICLDILTDRGIVRSEVEKDNFLWNPYAELTKMRQERAERISNTEESDSFIGDAFTSGGRNWL
jgi:hypothetical protein